MSAPLSAHDVAKVAHLSRLKLTADEQARMTEQLGRVLEYIAVLEEVNTDGVEPMAHAAEITNVLRADVETPSLPRDAALANAPKTDGECFLVPQILEHA